MHSEADISRPAPAFEDDPNVRRRFSRRRRISTGRRSGFAFRGVMT